MSINIRNVNTDVAGNNFWILLEKSIAGGIGDTFSNTVIPMHLTMCIFALYHHLAQPPSQKVDEYLNNAANDTKKLLN